jgi:plastocyanin
MMMKRLLVLAALTAAPLSPLVACEGEPPVNAPENPLGTQEVVQTPAAAESASEAPLPTAPMTACPPPPCSPTLAAPVAAAGSASAVPEPTAPETEPSPPPTVARGNIVGALTTKPASLAGQAVVYLEDGPTEDAPSRLQTVTIENKQMTFIPYISVVAVGGKVVFANMDPFPHNVFSPDNEKFNMGNIPQNGAHVRTFKNPGVYALLCNLHPGMLGYLAVTPSTWFARTDGKGNFTMKHVPTGTYKVTAWAPRQTPVTQSVTVGDADVTIHFDLHR